MNTRKALRELFREWYNDYLTVEKFAIDHNWSTEYAYRVITTGRELHNRSARS